MQNGKDSYIDSVWFEEYKKLSKMPGLSSLRAHNRTQEKHRFLRGEVENPTFIYQSLAVYPYQVQRDKLEKLKTRIETEETNDAIREIYSEKIEHKINDCKIIESIQKKDDARYDELMRERYGNVSTELATAVIRAYCSALEKIIKTSRGKVFDSAKELRGYLEDVQSRVETDAVHEFHLVEVSDVQEKVLSAREIKKLFELKRKEYGLSSWSVEIDVWGRSNSISVRHKDKKVVIPRGRRLTRSQALALAEHELGVHIRRREHGEATTLALLGVGLDGFLLGEEGLAKYYEQQVYDGAINSSLKSYLLTALALGVDGRKRSFREIYTVSELIFKSMKGRYFLSEVHSSKHYAWGKTVRLFRGATGQSKGVCSRRQLVYLEGYLRIKEIIDKEVLTEEQLIRGKYDPANEAHVLLLKKLSVL
ncbi:MAG: tyrosine/phenylalanine carboxypeptidase domain-containing protein [Candidatus Paceibacterota bacterium]